MLTEPFTLVATDEEAFWPHIGSGSIVPPAAYNKPIGLYPGGYFVSVDRRRAKKSIDFTTRRAVKYVFKMKPTEWVEIRWQYAAGEEIHPSFPTGVLPESIEYLEFDVEEVKVRNPYTPSEYMDGVILSNPRWVPGNEMWRYSLKKINNEPC